MDAVEERPMLVWASLACTLCTVALTLHHITYHSVMYRRGEVRPELQKCFVRIILIAPVYSVCAYFSLVMTEASGVFDAIRGIYEAYVLYVFAVLMLLFAGGEKRTLATHNDEASVQCVLSPCLPSLGSFGAISSAMAAWKWLILQFLILKPVCAITSAVLESNHLILQGDPYVKTVVVLSVTVAMAGVLNIYMSLGDDLDGLGAEIKFLALKLAVFFTVWQEVLFHVLVGQGIVSPEQDWYCWWTVDGHGCRRDVPRRGVQTVACIVIFEMLAFALVSTCVFSARDPALQRGTRVPQHRLLSRTQWLGKMLSLWDVARPEVEADDEDSEL